MFVRDGERALYMTSQCKNNALGSSCSPNVQEQTHSLVVNAHTGVSDPYSGELSGVKVKYQVSAGAPKRSATTTLTSPAMLQLLGGPILKTSGRSVASW